MPEETLQAWVFAIGIYEGSFDADKWAWKKPGDESKVDNLKPVPTVG